MAAHAPARLTRARRAALLRGIYVVLNEAPNVLSIANAALDAGVRILQYRAKSGPVPATLRALRALTRDRDALLVANDDWRAAARHECDGVHLGPGDDGFDDVAAVRAAQPGLLVGLSCGTVAEALEYGTQDADYLGVGAVYATASKADAGAPIGIAGLRDVARHTELPIAAIGGITSANLAEVRACGVAMAAVVSAIAAAPRPGAAARELVAGWGEE